ncbi:hypothetical protein P3T23_006239 [Paraburkholderia sp. GAS448]|jgi:hypothetical protein
MTNTGKVLITGVFLAGLGFASYLLFPKGEPSTTETGSVMSGSATTTTPGPGVGDAHVATGTVVHAVPNIGNTDDIETPPPPSPARALAPEPGLPARHLARQPQPEALPHQQPARRLGSADVEESFGSKAGPVSRVERERDGLRRHGSNQVSTAMTDELVRESAKLDPSLPPPDLHGRDSPDRRGSNPVAAAMTDQLIRDSTRINRTPQQPNRPASQ